MDYYSERIVPLLQSSNQTDQELERNIGLPKGIIYNWKSKRSKNYEKYCPQIAAYFNVSTDYLLGNTDEKKPPADSGEPDKDDLLKIVAKIDDEAFLREVEAKILEKLLKLQRAKDEP